MYITVKPVMTMSVVIAMARPYANQSLELEYSYRGEVAVNVTFDWGGLYGEDLLGLRSGSARTRKYCVATMCGTY
jgi:hypothetical protein